MDNTTDNLSVFVAIIVGHALVTIPVLLLMVIPLLLLLISPWGCLSLPLIFLLSWLWWAYVVPRWRMWALKHGADPQDLQWWAVATMLVWPKGWIFERTEIRPKGYDDGLGKDKNA